MPLATRCAADLSPADQPHHPAEHDNLARQDCRKAVAETKPLKVRI